MKVSLYEYLVAFCTVLCFSGKYCTVVQFQRGDDNGRDKGRVVFCEEDHQSSSHAVYHCRNVKSELSRVRQSWVSIRHLRLPLVLGRQFKNRSSFFLSKTAGHTHRRIVELYKYTGTTRLHTTILIREIWLR